MKVMEEQIQQNFQLYKGMGVGISLGLILFFQLLFPNRRHFRDLLMICGSCICSWAVVVRDSGLGTFDRVGFPYWLQVAATVLVLDFVAYAWHRANHVSRFLWRFHAVHHSFLASSTSL
jgi:sterol desaturase/sphingolipid hydroxylase (fatty acid hydroxylase superfamily)